MGTQFTSRLTPADRKKIVKGIEDALGDLVPSQKPRALKGKGKGGTAPAAGRKPRRPPDAQAIARLSGGQLRQLSDVAIGQVMTVVEARGLFTVFEGGAIFEDILKWLKERRNDAEFNGFKGIIKRYGMEASMNPVRDLTFQLTEIAEQAKLDPFRVAATTAAKAILAETVTRNVPPISGESQAQRYGRKLATLTLYDLVRRYINAFVFEVISRAVSMADPHGAAKIIRATIPEIQKSTERIAKKAVDQIKKEGKLCNVERTHQIVSEGLRTYVSL
jgi:hypothetical protein